MKPALASWVLLIVPFHPAWSLTADEEAKLVPSDGQSGDYFGTSVAIDGHVALIGAPSSDNGNGQNSGSAYVFTHSGGLWTEQAELIASDAAAGDEFGWRVALDGDVGVVAANRDDDNGEDSGSAYVFVRAGEDWTQQAKLLASDGESDDLFGFSVAVDADTVVVGASRDNDNGDESGSAYVFARSGNAWTQQAKLTASDGAAHDQFGCSVAIEDDRIVVGALTSIYNPAPGAAYVFRRTGTVWVEEAKLLASDGAFGDRFGVSTALAGETALIGAYESDGDLGSAYVFVRTGQLWTERAKLLASDGDVGDAFGFTVALDDDVAVIGAYNDSDNGTEPGSAYLFALTDGEWVEQAKLRPADGHPQDFFGVKVAVSGNAALIAANGVDHSGDQSGAAYVFRLSDDEVPATGDVGVPLLLLTMLGAGVYFARRRVGT